MSNSNEIPPIDPSLQLVNQAFEIGAKTTPTEYVDAMGELGIRLTTTDKIGVEEWGILGQSRQFLAEAPTLFTRDVFTEAENRIENDTRSDPEIIGMSGGWIMASTYAKTEMEERARQSVNRHVNPHSPDVQQEVARVRRQLDDAANYARFKLYQHRTRSQDSI